MITYAIKKFICFIVVLFFIVLQTGAQIIIAPDNSPQNLVQQLVGGGVSVSNLSYTGARGTAGFFKTISSSPALGLDSGIVLSTGYVQTNYNGRNIGIDGRADDRNGTNRASTDLGRPGDAGLATVITQNFDAAVLEFDFVPNGDSIIFRYVFGSEEYPLYNCSQYNDVFAFFISGPGIQGQKNIALVPGTNIPVAINSINSGTSGGTGTTPTNCSNMGPGSPFIQYYVNNAAGSYITFNGFTKVLEARAKVQPCQVYHLKIAIADGFDGFYDSGVFLEAKSLRSDGITIQNDNPVSSTGDPYLVEGCTSGGIKIFRRKAENFVQQVSLIYGGSALNSVDVNTLPSVASIAANDSFVYIPIVPVADHLPEGIEKLKIYVSNGCANGAFADSIEIQIKDYDTLGITPNDSAGVCLNSTIQLAASSGYNSYSWQPAALLSNAAIHNPVASPQTDNTFFICTAVLGNCEARDSVKLNFKKILLASKQDIICKNAATGQIKLSAGWQWQPPLRFWINNLPQQTDSSFYNLTKGNYVVKVQDASGCTDSLAVIVNQLYTDLNIDRLVITPPTCVDTTLGQVAITGTGGSPSYTFSVDGINYHSDSALAALTGNHTAIIKDQNNCIDTASFRIFFNNPVTVNAGKDTSICEGTQVQLQGTSNAASLTWSPSANVNNTAIINPIVNPVVSTNYIVTAKNANCIKTDTVFVNVYPAPTAKAGNDTSVCTGGAVQLKGSGGVQYRWSPSTFLDNAASIIPIAKPFNSITYYLTVTDQHNCSSLQPDALYIRTVPSVIAFAGNDTIAATGQPIQLYGQQLRDTSARQYIWTPSTGLNNSAVANPIATLTKDQVYRLTMRTPQGCEGYDDITIKVYNGPEIYVPSGFTPNGDGRNDVLRAVAAGVKIFKYFNIYNRWGQLVFHTTIPEKGWDGKINGQLQINQSFVWIAEGVGYNDVLVQRRGSVVVVN